MSLFKIAGGGVPVRPPAPSPVPFAGGGGCLSARPPASTGSFLVTSYLDAGRQAIDGALADA